MGIGCNVKVSVKKLSGDVRAWLFLSMLGIGAMFKVFGFAELPKRVDKAEVGIEENESKVDKLAGSINKYIAVQEAKEETREVWEAKKEIWEKDRIDLMLKMIDKIGNNQR